MPSPIFLSRPKKILVSISTRIGDEREETAAINYHEDNLNTADDGIYVYISRCLRMPGRTPLTLLFQPEEAKRGCLFMATPEFVYELPVSSIPPAQVHLHREFLDGYRSVTCLVPLTDRGPDFDINAHRRDVKRSIRPDTDEDTFFRRYHSELMLDFHVLVLDYTPNTASYYSHYADADAMLRHFTA